MSKVPKKSVSKKKVSVAVPKMPRVIPPKAYNMSIIVILQRGHFSFSWATGFTVKEKNYTLFLIYEKS